jgi:toxin YoeB
MQIIFLPDANDDLNYWVKSGNKAIIKKITQLIEAIQNNPYEGIGKPESLRYNLSGAWSRRINKEHRIIYEIVDEKILIHSVRGYYS